MIRTQALAGAFLGSLSDVDGLLPFILMRQTGRKFDRKFTVSG